MTQYDIDFEIIYTIKSGFHNFNEIWSKIKGVGSKQTFSKHLSQLVELRYIRKEIENEKPRYYLGRTADYFESDKGFIGILNKKISTIEEKSKKVPDKKLLKEFVDDSQDLLIVLSQINLSQIILLDSSKKDKQYNAKPMIGLNEKKMELINKLITIRMNILEKRDPELAMSFFELVQNNLQNFLSKN